MFVKPENQNCQEVLTIIAEFKPYMIPVASLLLVDQVIKIIISSAFMQYDFDVINNFIRFNPQINTDLSWAGNYINIFSNLLVTVLLNVLAIFVFLSGYLLYRAKKKQTRFYQ